ncbi:hypothetical protein [Geitlerinema calcuttense]|uniref:Uncharacterized protein n=1 Tax=Geitlerinema calcuttense NRMC-F 0142 TaxID=2922238 RepID=A0ABT7LZW5_9CYAN|nr:hypothetical protein [Geitlerinema calcuttense]MDL5057544.1 hypothetical protein [Geitlerinema calcuttense NRMC-F 0142]
MHEAIEAASSSQGLPFPPQVSVVRIYPDSINLYLHDSFVGVILQDAGLARPEVQNIPASEAQQQFGNPIQVSISLKRLEQADGDVLFVWTGEDTSQASQAAQSPVATTQSDANAARLPRSRRLDWVGNNYRQSHP